MSTMLHDLSGRTALVTGGSRGLGREMVLAFAQSGADVVIVSRKQDACDALADEVRSTTGRRAWPIAAHVGRWDAVGELHDRVRDEVGQVDVLVNNAGMAPLYPSVTEATEELFDKTFGLNLKGPFRLSALVGQDMADGAGGSIVNVSSIASMRPTAHDMVYAAAKAGLNAITLGFAQAFGPSVRVNTIVAGPFLTDISKAWDMEAFEADAQSFPLGRAGRPEEIVGTALYLASAASSFTTGALIPVDGGRLAATL